MNPKTEALTAPSSRAAPHLPCAPSAAPPAAGFRIYTRNPASSHGVAGADVCCGRRSHGRSALQSARLPVNLIGSPINYANRLIGSPINSQSTRTAVLQSSVAQG